MNTYIISVLVIFYLQLKHGLPTITEVPMLIANKIKFSTENKLGHFVKEFYEFYGKTFEPKSHLISIKIGKWQQKVQENQKHFTSEQKRFVFQFSFHLILKWNKRSKPRLESDTYERMTVQHPQKAKIQAELNCFGNIGSLCAGHWF